MSETKTESNSVLKVALAGNPNVGKSTVFNALTGMKQHTGNWAGKTVGCAEGRFLLGDKECILTDIPGTYSLSSHSPEEEIARDHICFEAPDAVIVVCDATALERNLNLALQILELNRCVVLCVNLLDEARKKGFETDLELLSARMGIRVAGCVARDKKGLDSVLRALRETVDKPPTPISVDYGETVESMISDLISVIDGEIGSNCPISKRFLALRLIEMYASEDKAAISSFFARAEAYTGTDLSQKETILKSLELTFQKYNAIDDEIEKALFSAGSMLAEEISRDVCTQKPGFRGNSKDRAVDKILTGKISAYPIMLLLLACILWITVSGANLISNLLSLPLGHFGMLLRSFLSSRVPTWLCGLLCDGVYTVLSYVVSVMLPPMAIFFPLFTILEDSGYLPRIAFNLDAPFAKCKSCGKQALTMCMGFGCNAVGVTGCRIIDSPRERMIATLTNSLVPCNGRFPLLVSLITVFFISGNGAFSGIAASLLLTMWIMIAILMTFLVSSILSHTILKGMPSSFTLELPPYRSPQIGKVIIRSILDRTVFVLGRAIISAIPAGIIIWITANLYIGELSLLRHAVSLIDPAARLIGLDGVILIAFILGFPANEIVIPIMVMAYMQSGVISGASSLAELENLLIANGWTPITAICVMIFSLMHWPCATTLLTIKKETGSLKWTLAAIVIPTVLGVIFCMVVNLFGIIFR